MTNIIDFPNVNELRDEVKILRDRLMDHGKKIFAKIRKIELKRKWYKIDIAIFLEEERIMSEDSNS